MIDGIQFSSFGEFLNMGGYAFNVWSVYLIFFVFVVFNLVLPVVKKKQIIRELKRRSRREPPATESDRAPEGARPRSVEP